MIDLGALSGVFLFVMGLCVGSFLNVVSYRLPREESIVWPGSHCPACGKPIAWHDNIPLLSWLFLGGKCRGCKAGISPRYFLGELVCGCLWLGAWLLYGQTLHLAAAVILFSLLLVVIFTDFETGLIPDRITFPGMAAGFLISGLFPALHGRTEWLEGLRDSGLGLLTGGGILFLVGWIGDRVFRKETMGGGDVKLLALIGAFLGPMKVLFVFLIAPMTALPFALYMRLVRRSETIPYGPFLALTGALMFVWGGPIVKFFLQTYGVE